MAIFIVDEESPSGPSLEQLEDQVEMLADLLRVAYLAVQDSEVPEVDLLEAIEDLFVALGLEL